MDSAAAIDCRLVLDRNSLPDEIDPKRARFPCCIVWTPLPVLSWFIPFIGHIGICREDGVILDFAGPNFVCVDNFAFGATAQYIQIRKEQCLLFTEPDKDMSWDDAVRKCTQEFQHKAYNLFTCNCHSFVANNLNRLCYGGYNRWNVVNLAALVFLKGRWVNKTAIMKSYLPFILVFSLGILLGGLTFLIGLAAFSFVLVCWFIVGTYCLKNLIQL
ncbi:protein RTE1-HOMOLOG [Aristolochia californica]|uniref:protein RTE1-HOMOLOG n=1 Tax=Aristolochia californica TaxID=171875 RepID=UPI0035D8A6E7